MSGGPSREGARSSEVPAELRGREVSARVFFPLLDGAERRGVPLDDVVAGTGYSVAELRDHRGRVAWPVFMTVLENLGKRFDDATLVEIGFGVLDTPLLRTLLLPGRVLLPLADVYRWGAAPDGPVAKMVAAQDIALTQTDERTLRLDVTMKPGYTCTRAFWLVRLGFLRSVPRAFGLPLADGSVEITPGGARYEIVLPAPRRLATRLRERVSFFLAAKDVAAELRRAHDELHARYLDLQREVEARRAAEAELRSLNAELERRVADRTSELELVNRGLSAANADLTTFSWSVAHDLRSPLRAIHGFAGALLEDHGEQLDDEARRKLDRIAAAALRMGTLIDALLALSRVSRVDLKRDPIDLAEVAAGVVETLRVLEPIRDVRVEIQAGLRTEADLALVRVLLENLVGNAWKFTKNRPDASIEITRVEDSPAPVFCVRDNGVGFDMRHAELLFVPFGRLNAAKALEGTGIGLAIADRIVRRHGGKIWAEARPGEGAAFFFTLR